MDFDLNIIIEHLPYFPEAALITLQVTTLGILAGLLLGLITAFFRISRFKILQYPARLYIFLVRGTPLLLQLFVIYYGVSNYVQIPAFPSAVLALGIHNGAYIGEIFRGTIQSISQGQMEAARSIGMSYTMAMKRIILPQAFKRAIPPLGNQFIIALKDSSLASTITVSELLLTSRQFGSSTFRYMEMLVTAGFFYIILTSIFTTLVSFLENKLKHGSEMQSQEVQNA